MIRSDALTIIAGELNEELAVVNLGFPSQELYAIRDSPRFFYMLGSMGLVSSIALGVALTTPATVVAIDGDGGLLMNLGSLTTVALARPGNLKWLVIDNGSYGSTGDQPTATARGVSLAALARAAGIARVDAARDPEELRRLLARHLREPGLAFLVVHVEPGNRAPGPIPLDPLQLRDRFRAAVPVPRHKRGHSGEIRPPDGRSARG